VGRDARLELVFERRRGRTVIAHAYAEPPLRVGRAHAIGDAAYVIVVCSGPGVFAGDSLRQTIRLEPGTRVVLVSQAALQVHPGSDGRYRREGHDVRRAVTCQEYVVAEDAELHCHWDPVIPFADAALAQQFHIDIGSTSRLYWSDALLAGRASRGEAWRFRELEHELRLRVDGSLAYLERYRLAPADRRPARTWIAGDATHLGTTLVHHPQVCAGIVEPIHRALQMVEATRVAADLVAPHLMTARLMGSSGARFAAVRAELRRQALEAIFHAPELAGRK
jgi:urease accessory protein UreH